MLKVAWLPAHPADGSQSMLHYWRALQNRSHSGDFREFELTQPFPSVAGQVCRAGKWRRFWSKRVLYPVRMCAMPRADIYHLLDHSFGHVLRYVPKRAAVVATVHDLAPLWAGNELSTAQRRRFEKAVSHLHNAARLIAPSNFTAAAIVSELGIHRDRISVVPMGTDLQRRTVAGTDPDRTFILSVGSVEARKNLGALVEICRRASTAIRQLRLVRVGERLPTGLRAQIAAALNGELEERGRVDDRVLADLYGGALALVVPSRLEGFGLPVLEAMACGCPVVSSNAASLPEAGGEVALYFDPDNPAMAARHIVEMATQPLRRAAVVAAGLARSAQFTWSAHATRVADIYREVAAAPRNSISPRGDPAP